MPETPPIVATPDVFMTFSEMSLQREWGRKVPKGGPFRNDDLHLGFANRTAVASELLREPLFKILATLMEISVDVSNEDDKAVSDAYLRWLHDCRAKWSEVGERGGYLLKSLAGFAGLPLMLKKAIDRVSRERGRDLTLAEAVQMGDDGWLAVKNFGETSLRNLKVWLQSVMAGRASGGETVEGAL